MGPFCSLPYRRLLALVFASTILPAWSDPTTAVGDPQKPGDLPGALRQAYTSGARDITINPGSYDLPPVSGSDTIWLAQWQDATVHATGVTLIFEGLNQRPVHLIRCTNVTWDGGTFRFAHPAFTQGRIVALGSDAQGPYYDWQVDAGYTTKLEESWHCFDIVDQKTRKLKVGTSDWFPASMTPFAEGLFRLHYATNHQPNLAVKDWLVTRAPAGTTIVHVDSCHACALKNVALQNAGFGAFFESGGGSNHYLRCRVGPGPRPSGATEDELVGCGADGFHSVETDAGPDIEDCAFNGVFLDDCIAIHGTFGRITEADGASLTISAPHPAFAVGDAVRITDTHGLFVLANCTAVEDGPDRSVRITLDHNPGVTLRPGEETDKTGGTRVYVPARCGQGYKILRCHLGDTRSRGILVKADNGLIENCTIEDTSMSGVSIGPEFWWNEAGYCWNVTVTHNTFRGCNRENGDQAAVWVHGDGAMGNRNITIQENSFDSCYGHAIMRVNQTDGATIAENRISGAFQLKLSPPGSVISLAGTSKVVLRENIVSAQGPFAGDLVDADQVSCATLQHDDPAGIRLDTGTGQP
jgi:hypothetical protein